MTTIATTPTRPKAAKNAKAAKADPVATFVPPAETPLIQDMGGTLMDVPLTDIVEPDWAPDRIPGPEDQAEIEGLARSMHAATQLQPILLERTSRGLVRVFGRRRVAAARLLNWKTIRAVVVPELSEVQRRTVIAVENIQRKQLTGIEETLGVMELVELQALEAARQVCLETRSPLACQGAWGGKIIAEHEIEKILACPADQIAANRHDVLQDHRVRDRACVLVGALLSRDTKWVRDRMYIGRLDKGARDLIRAGKLPLQHAREIAKVADENRRSELAKAYAAGGDTSISDTEPGRFDSLQDEVSRCLMHLTQVPWKLDVPFAERAACVTCPHNSANQPGLFDHGGIASYEMRSGVGTGGVEEVDEKEIAAGICTNHACFADKLRFAKAHLASTAKRVVDEDKQPSAIAKEVLVESAMKEKIDSRKKLRGSSAKGSARASVSSNSKSPENQARRDFEDAMLNYCAKADTQLNKKYGADPVKALYAELLRDYLEQVAAQKEATAAKTLKSGQFHAVVKGLAAPNGAGLVTMARLAGRKLSSWEEILPSGHNGISALPVCERVIEILKIDVGPAPKLEDFMPKPAPTAPTPPTVDAAAAKPAGKKSGGRAKGKARKGRKA